jgi:hypothetical protein
VLQALSFRPEMERAGLAVGVHHSGISLRMGGLAGREIQIFLAFNGCRPRQAPAEFCEETEEICEHVGHELR